jgi:hypothetical protein
VINKWAYILVGLFSGAGAYIWNEVSVSTCGGINTGALYSVGAYIQRFTVLGALLAKQLAHLPSTSKAACSSLSENFLNAKRVKVNAMPKVMGYLRVLRFPLTGKVDR